MINKALTKLLACVAVFAALTALRTMAVTTNFFANFQTANGTSNATPAALNSGTAVGTWSILGTTNSGVGAISSNALNRAAVFAHNGGNIASMQFQLTNNFVVLGAGFPQTITNDAGSGTRVLADFNTSGSFTGSAETRVSFKWGVFGTGNPGNMKYSWARGLDGSGNEVFEILLVGGSADNTRQIYVRGATDNSTTLTSASAGTPQGTLAVPSLFGGINNAAVNSDPTLYITVSVQLTNNTANFDFLTNGVSAGSVASQAINSLATTISKLEFSQSWNTNAQTQNKGFWVDDVVVSDGPLNVPIPQRFLWTGADSSTWDINATTNWTDLATATAAKYVETSPTGVEAVFDDSSSVTNVSISTTVAPTAVVLSNSTALYTLSGNGVGGAAQIIKNGTASLTLTGVNNNTGGVKVNGGTVIVSADSNLGSLLAPVQLNNGGTLRVTANLTNTRPVIVTGASTLNVDPGITVQAGGTLSAGTGNVLVKDGSGTLVLTNSNPAFRFHVVNGTTILDRSASVVNNNLGFMAVGNGGFGSSAGAFIMRSNSFLSIVNQDLNIGDSLGSSGQFYLQDNAVLSARNLLVGKFDTGSTGIVYQTGGVFTNANASSPAVILGGANAAAVGCYGAWYLSGGRADVLGNFQVGAWNTGEMFISGGAVNIYNGFPVVGRQVGGTGNLVVSGGAFNNFGGNNLIVGEQGTGTLTITNTGVVNLTHTPLRVGGNGGANVGTGTVNLNAGGQLTATAVLGTPGGIGTVNFDGGTLRAATNSATFIDSLLVNNVLAGGAIIDTDAFTVTALQGLDNGGGGGGLTKLGSGTLALAGTNTYTGATVVSNGTLNVWLPAAGSTVTVAPGATFGVTVGRTSADTWNPGTLTLQSSNRLKFDFGAGSVAPSGALLTAATVNASGTHTVAVSGIGWPVGTTTLLDYGTISGGGTFVFDPLPMGVVGYLTNNPTATAIQIVVSFSASQRTWYGNTASGSFGGLWDIATTLNWDGGVAQYNDNGSFGDAVTFDSSTSPNLNAELPATVRPVSVLVTNVGGGSADFTFFGPGRISGIGTLTKDGGGNLTLNMTNDYNGGTLLRQGNITLNTNNVLPMAGIVTLGSPSNTANLVLNGFNQTVGGLIAGGSGGGNRRVYNGSATAATLTLNVTAGVTNSYTHTLGNTNAIDGDNFSVVKNGAGEQRISGCTYLGTTTVNAGRFVYTGNAGVATNAVTVNSSGTLAGAGIVGGAVQLNAGSTLSPANNLASINTLTVSNNVTMSGAVTCAFDLSKDTLTNDIALVVGNINYSGALVATNLGTNALVGGETFQLFNVTGTKSGTFSTVTVLPATGVSGTFDASTGILTITAAPSIPTTPTNVVATFGGGNVSLSWPSNYVGWSLQVQTNSRSVGLTPASNTWFTVPGSSLVTSTNFSISPANPTVFYRLFYAVP